MSEGHAVVTDFGVAKAVSSSSGGQLTSLGLALGTPAYMAPEQAAADPHVDHRADLYSIGVVAYEMLAGRTPFAAASPQAMLAAHITQAPDPLEQHRRSVPPALSAVVMRCLEKHAADRWQSAAEVSAQLESIPLETSGGHAPTGAQPAASSGTEAAIRRGHPLRVTALFLAASAGMLGLTYFLVQRLRPAGLGLHRRGRAAAARPADHGGRGAARAAARPGTDRRHDRRDARGAGAVDQLATGDDGWRDGVRRARRARHRLHRDAPPRDRPGGHAGGVGRAGGARAADPRRLREPHPRLHPGPVAHRSLPGRPVPVAHAQTGGPRLADRDPRADGAAGTGHAESRAGTRGGGAHGREGGRRRADRSGGPRLRALGEPGRGRGRADPHRGARIGRRRRFAPRCDRPPLPEASRADRRVAHDDPRGPAAGGRHHRIAGGTAQVHRREPADRERPGRRVGAAARRGRGTGHRVCDGLAQAGRHDGQLRALADP